MSAQHDGDVGAIDVGIHQAHFVPQIWRGPGEIYGDGGLPYPALTTGNGDEIFYARNWLAFGLLHRTWCWRHCVLIL